MDVIGEVLKEVRRATDKFPTWPVDPIHAFAVLGEECGELNKAVLQATYEPHMSGPKQVREEAIQTAAMAIRFLMSLDDYVYCKSMQAFQENQP
jgi:NTP pyrophosphatase (non-canonical NTP hydrolase)